MPASLGPCRVSELSTQVCPGIDHGRIAFFVAFWERRGSGVPCLLDGDASPVASRFSTAARLPRRSARRAWPPASTPSTRRLTGRVARRLDCTPDWLRALLKRLEALLPPRARAQLDKARNPPPRRAQRSIWDGGFAVKKKTANGGVRRLGNGRSGAAPAAAARAPAPRRTFTETGDAPAAAARAPAPRRTFTETGDDLAFFLEAGRQREARAAARSPS